MAVDDIRCPVHIVQCCKSCFCEIAELRDIVDKVCIRLAPAEELVVVNEVIYHPIPDIFHDSDIE